ncbi:MAG TPA: hypothetical protein VNN21_10230, partial [Dehalococcoidia bacterium]|nr:hypothetical protein [Dehalococcoidia bacterium]
PKPVALGRATRRAPGSAILILGRLIHEADAPTLRPAAVREALSLQASLGNRRVRDLISRPPPASVQRQDWEAPSPDAPGGPSLLDEGSRLSLDPELMAQMRAMQTVRELLDPDALRPRLFDIPDTLGSTAPDIFSVPELPQPEPLVPRGGGPSRPRPAEASDVLEAVLAIPAIDSAIERLRGMALERVTGFYRGLSTEGKAGVITSLAVVGAGSLAGVLATPAAREFALDQLNGRVLPVPGLDGLAVELNTEGENIMFGLHLDVGRLLPEPLGFGPAEPSPIGAPPGRP